MKTYIVRVTVEHDFEFTDEDLEVVGWDPIEMAENEAEDVASSIFITGSQVASSELLSTTEEED